jgi:hypothetical protein
LNFSKRTFVVSLLATTLLAGCGGNVKLKAPTIPEPLLEQIEMSVGVRMPENFEHFVHEEEVWIRYRLKVYDTDGKLVSNWPVAAYGKSQTTTLGNSDALQRAAILAMRDAAALMIMKFDNVTRISSLAGGASQPPAPLLRRQQSSEAGAQAAAPEGASNE